MTEEDVLEETTCGRLVAILLFDRLLRVLILSTVPNCFFCIFLIRPPVLQVDFVEVAAVVAVGSTFFFDKEEVATRAGAAEAVVEAVAEAVVEAVVEAVMGAVMGAVIGAAVIDGDETETSLAVIFVHW